MNCLYMLREKEYIFQDNVLILSKIKKLIILGYPVYICRKNKENILQNFVQKVFKWR